MSYTTDATGSLPAVRAARPDGWTVERQEAFLVDFSGHGRVADAARAVDMSVASAYRLRAREYMFDFGWRAAAALAYERLRDLALDRAVNGVEAPRYYRGAVAGATVRHSDRLLLGLLNHLRPEGEVNHITGKRGAPAEAAKLWAAAVDAYATARETGAPPVVPEIAGGAPRRTMTREEALARLAARPRVPPPGEDDDWGLGPNERKVNRETPSPA